MQRFHAKTFSLVLSGAVLLALLLPVAINVGVDPYGIYRQHDSASLSRIDQFHNMRSVKPQQVRRRPPEVAVIGSSIAGRMATDNAAWQNRARFNLSLPGITPHEMYRMVRHSHSVRPLQELVLALDFSAYSTSMPRIQFGFPERRMLLDGGDMGSWSDRIAVATELQRSLFTSVSLIKSFEALNNARLRTRQSMTGAIYHGDGSWERPNLARRVARFERKANGFIRKFRDISADRLRTELVRDLLLLCYREGIQTAIVINPMHLLQLENLRQVGAFGSWKQWHRELVTLNRALAASFGGEAIPILVFNRARGIVDEPLTWTEPELQPWFEDGIHYSSRLGRLLLAEALEQSPEIGETAETLDPASVEGYLEGVETLLDQYARDHRQELERVRPAFLASP